MDLKTVNIYEGLDSTLMLLRKLRNGINLN